MRLSNATECFYFICEHFFFFFKFIHGIAFMPGLSVSMGWNTKKLLGLFPCMKYFDGSALYMLREVMKVVNELCHELPQA